MTRLLMMTASSPSLVDLAQQALARVLRDGDLAIDATVGNGHDTLFLANAVGPQGRVYGFDIQQQALDATWRRLDEAGLSDRVALHHAGHETMGLWLPASMQGRARGVMFNLGYLPGGDKRRTTAISTTLAALQQSRQYLAADGLLSIIAYTGHPGGAEEAEAIQAWIDALPPQRYLTTLSRPQGTRHSPPQWWLVQGLSG